MLDFLTAIASAIPAVGKIVDTVTGHNDKASEAAKVAADPAAPADVRKAAADVATKAVDKAASAQKQALAQVAGDVMATKKPNASASDNTMMYVVIGALVLLSMKGR